MPSICTTGKVSQQTASIDSFMMEMQCLSLETSLASLVRACSEAEAAKDTASGKEGQRKRKGQHV